MKISNVRLKGFACNSSSTHSVIILRDGKKASDYGADERSDFGWQFFTLGTEGAKRNYLALMIKSALSYELGDEIASLVAQDWVSPLSMEDIKEGYIDHQSTIVFPVAFDRYPGEKMRINIPFAKEFIKSALRDDVLILGGNDNGDSSHELLSEGNVALWHDKLPKDGFSPVIARQDGEWWTLFNKENGAKTRLSFNDHAAPYTKSKAPELVDLSLTDYCNKGCSYCYRGSTPEGQHASTAFINDIIYKLAEMEVFEIAFGGGEPTVHPDFAEFVDKAHQYGIVPNVTTRNIKWLIDPRNLSTISKLGAIAVSIDSLKELQSIQRRLGYRQKSLEARSVPFYELRQKIRYQYVMGSAPQEEFESLVRTYGSRITLLGYKTTGRGQSALPAMHKNSLADISMSDKNSIFVNIDTVLAQELEQQGFIGKDSGRTERSDIFYSTKEGAFSCFIDGVKMTMAPSSFCAPEEHIAFPELPTNRWRGYSLTLNEMLAMYKNLGAQKLKVIV